MEPKLANIGGFHCAKCREATCLSLKHLLKCFNNFTFVVSLLTTAENIYIYIYIYICCTTQQTVE